MNMVLDYYENFLGGPSLLSTSTFDELSQLLQFRCSLSVVDLLQAPILNTDIQEVFFSLPNNKSPGPDGYPAEFFTAHWKTVGSDMIMAVQEFFSTGRLLQQWNTTILTLIPKKQNVVLVSDFRPISCCNTTYKVISKILANRLKQVLPLVISNTQSAFIPGRLLVENVLMATELIQGYNWKNITKRSTLKIDLKKAFDSLNWSFILLILRALRFPDSYVHLISQCITTTRFSVAVNGELGGYFRGARGLRQGDPLSPYLFVLAMEVLAQLLNNDYFNGQIGYHPSASNPPVTHLAFADDIMVFFDGQQSSLERIAATLDGFSAWSGLTMNRQKTELFVAGMSELESSDLSSLGFSIGSLPVRYLGLPLMHRKLQICDYRPLLDQLKRRFSSWSSRALTYAGRRQLLASIISGTLNFWFSSFILPKGCIKSIESMCSRFLWNGNITSKAAAKISWKSVCMPCSKGGLGLRDLSSWNTTLSLKLIWLLHCESESLWASWTKRNRLKGASIWSFEVEKQTSWIWKSILRLRPLAERFLKCDIGDGTKASFWFDYWLPIGPLIKFFGDNGPQHIGVPLHATIRDSCSLEGWRLRPARSPKAEELQIMLCSVPLPSQSTSADSYKWCVSEQSSTNFSTSHTWEAVRHCGQQVLWEKIVWFSGHIPRHAFHMWVAMQDRLPTQARLATWDPGIDNSCLLCANACEETRDHLFLRCSFSERVWRLITVRLGYRPTLFHTWTALCEWLRTSDTTCSNTLRRLVTQATVYQLWAERNSRLHNGLSSTPHRIFKDLDRTIRNSILARKEMKKFRGLMQAWLKFS